MGRICEFRIYVPQIIVLFRYMGKEENTDNSRPACVNLYELWPGPKAILRHNFYAIKLS